MGIPIAIKYQWQLKVIICVQPLALQVPASLNYMKLKAATNFVNLCFSCTHVL